MKSNQHKCQLKILLPLQVNIDLSHQQAEINRLRQVAQQWSMKGSHQHNQVPASHNPDRFNINVRGRSVRPSSTFNMLLVQNHRTSTCFDRLEQKRYGYHNRRLQHNHHQEPDQRRYLYASHASSNHTNIDTTLENFSAKISVQLLVWAVLGSIQEFNRKD